MATGRKIVNTAGFWSAAAALMFMPGALESAEGCWHAEGSDGGAAVARGCTLQAVLRLPAAAASFAASSTCPLNLGPAALPACAAARSVTAGVAFTSLSLACAGFSRGGFSVNHMDVAPKFAGVVM